MVELGTAGEVPGSRRKASANRAFPLVVGLSIFLHAVAIGSAIYAQGTRPPVQSFQNSMPVQLVQLGRPRDPKLLPRKVEEAPAAAPEEGVALDRGKDAKDTKKDAKKTEQKLSDRARQLLEGTSPDAKLDAAASKLSDREGDPNGDLHGTTTDPAAAASGYTRAILSTLQANYHLPETIPPSQRKFLKASVLLYVDRDGAVTRYEFQERHPNEVFMGALESMLKSIHLPPPPAELVASVRDGGVLVRFSL